MVVNHLNCGTLRPYGSLLLTGHGGLLEPAKLVCHCLLVESTEGLILVDTGLGLNDVEEPAESLGRLSAGLLRVEQDLTRTAFRQVQALGYEPREVRHIVMTHLDLDHAGGLKDFPWADVHVLQPEYEAATYPEGFIDKNRYRSAQFEHGPHWRIHQVGKSEKWFGFDKVRILPGIEPEIFLIPLLGHSRGHCGVAIATDYGWLLHAGDAFMHRNELDLVEPDPPIGIRVFEHIVSDDRDAFIANQALVRQLAHDQEDAVQVICSHDPDMMDVPLVPAEGKAYVL